MNLKSVLNNNCTASISGLTTKLQKLIRPNYLDVYLQILIVKVLQTVQVCSMKPRESVRSKVIKFSNLSLKLFHEEEKTLTCLLCVFQHLSDLFG